MPHYLRLLKIPELISESQAKNQSSKKSDRSRKYAGHTLSSINTHSDSKSYLKCTFTCTTDLGDKYYEADLKIHAYILDSKISSTPLASGNLDWNSGDRVVSKTIEISCLEHLDSSRILYVCLKAGDAFSGNIPQSGSSNLGLSEIQVSPRTKSARASLGIQDHTNTGEVPAIISIMSPVNSIHNHAIKSKGFLNVEQQVLRRFRIGQARLHAASLLSKHEVLDLDIYEEIGESIARHIWDAALAMLVCIVGTSSTELEDHLRHYLEKPIAHTEDAPVILELGSGCGIVGIGLAQMLPGTNLILSDLPEAMDILKTNIEANEDRYAPGTNVEAEVVDWEWAIDVSATDVSRKDQLTRLSPDLVLVSDCTYNSNSFKALTSILLRVVEQSHRRHPPKNGTKLDVLVSYKFRHESESQFFEDMRAAGFEVLFKHKIEFPDQSRLRIGLELEEAEIYGFALTESGSES